MKQNSNKYFIGPLVGVSAWVILRYSYEFLNQYNRELAHDYVMIIVGLGIGSFVTLLVLRVGEIKKERKQLEEDKRKNLIELYKSANEMKKKKD